MSAAKYAATAARRLASVAPASGRRCAPGRASSKTRARLDSHAFRLSR